MNNRHQIICETVARLMEISANAKEDSGTDVFVSWSPHCGLIDATVYLNVWEQDKSHETFSVFLVESPKQVRRQINDFLAKIIAYLGSADTRDAEIRQLSDEAERLRKKLGKVRRKLNNARKEQLEALKTKPEENYREADKP